jgi:hypothetical protein
VASVVFAGLWSGLLLMLTTVLHPVMEPMDGRGFALFLHQFLPPARKAASNYVAVLGMLYDVMLAWDPDAPPADWEATRGRYFAINSSPALRRSCTSVGLSDRMTATSSTRARMTGPGAEVPL